jgi:hypothetical protein
LSFFARLGRQRAQENTSADLTTHSTTTPAEDAADPAGPRGRVRVVLASVATTLGFLLVWFGLTAPNELDQLTWAAFVRIPVEGLVGVGLLLILPPRVRRVVAVVAGAVLGLLSILKILDMGFFQAFARPFDPVLDWTLLVDGVDFLTRSLGQVEGIATVIAVVAFAVGVVVLMALAVLRLTRLVVQHNTATVRTLAVLTVVWVALAVFGVQIRPGVPVASGSAATLAYDHALQVGEGLRDRQKFTAQAAVDPFHNTPGTDLLTALRGKDVMMVWVESYGRSAIEDPGLAPEVDAVLNAGTSQLRTAGFDSRSAFLTSSTVGGGSWWAHSTLESGLWINNQQRYRALIAGDRLTLTGAFRRAGWQTVSVQPANTRDWPEAAYFGFDRVYDDRNLGYRGPRFNFASMPDQYTLSAFQRTERAKQDRPPLMAEIVLLSSHSPWKPLPRLIDWNAVDNGPAFEAMPHEGIPPAVDPAQIRLDYRQSIVYSLSTLISYVQTYGDDNLVLLFAGDHQPAPIVTGAGASRDVPITIVAHDPAVLDPVSGWGWQDGLNPSPQAPVWGMDTFRDRFLSAFGSHARPPG